MAEIVFSQRALVDLERFVEFEDSLKAESMTSVLIVEDGLRILQRHPLVGRRVEKDLRELVISRGRTGYVALYRFLPVEDQVLVLALRHQRELGYSDEVEE
jgi:plasmid stabilization system protein ParE